MKMTYGVAAATLELLGNLNETGKLGFVIARNRRKLVNELDDYLIKRDEILNKYGNESEDKYFIPREKIPEFRKEMSEYDEIEFEFSPITTDEDTFCSGSLTSSEMFTLDWMIKNNNKILQ